MRPMLAIILLVLTIIPLGCGNVYLRGDAATAVETSAMDSYLVAQKAASDQACPSWVKAYLDENFKQWRAFARSNRKEATWGPRLPSESSTSATPIVGVPAQ